MWQICAFYAFSFGCSGRISYLCIGFCNMLIINTYFDSCNMDATSGANALIVNNS